MAVQIVWQGTEVPSVIVYYSGNGWHCTYVRKAVEEVRGVQSYYDVDSLVTTQVQT